MKIFNWMHRKLHPATDYSRVSYNKVITYAIIEAGRVKGEPSSAPCEGERDKEALLLKDLNHMLDGFLTIGTLGHGHGHPVLLPSIQEEQDSAAEGLLRAVAPAPLVEARRNPTVSVEPKEETVVVEEEKKRVQVTATATEEEPMRPSCEILEPLLMERKKKDNGRTTLADLLAADGKKSPPVAASGGKKQASSCTKCNKKLPNKWKDPLPPPATVPKKLHRLMSRMMKKKIHPDATHVRGGASDATTAGDEGRLLPRGHIETT